jgi:hypothetical protein
MSTRLLGVALAGAMALVATTALAVDVRNDDEVEHQLMFGKWKDGSSFEPMQVTIKLAPGEIAQGVCESCMIQLGEGEENAEFVYADPGQVVTIGKGGALSVQ